MYVCTNVCMYVAIVFELPDSFIISIRDILNVIPGFPTAINIYSIPCRGKPRKAGQPKEAGSNIHTTTRVFMLTLSSL
jgi:hypothetical protein